VGLFGLYCNHENHTQQNVTDPSTDSLSWLNISDATVVTFTIPTMTAFVCFVWFREPFTLKEALAGLIAFAGVVFVTRPPWLFSRPPADSISSQRDSNSVPHVSPAQRTFAIAIAIIGAFGASIAYATIRVIGKRAHSLISVNYFAVIATAGSAAIILVHPDLHFVFPEYLSQWGLIAIIGLAGFLLQFLLTEGLQREKAGRATNMTYLQLVFALIVERAVWGTTPPMESFFGAGLIISAAIWVGLQKSTAAAERNKGNPVHEESGLLDNSEGRGP
jgi:drug/metabolite transporter (DMT)-like permease